MYLIDSSTLISFFRETEGANYRETIKLINMMGQFFISDYIFSEVLTVLRLRERPEIVQKAVELLYSNADVIQLRLTDEEFEKTTEFFLEKRKISFVDASLVVMAHARGLALITQDKSLLKAFSEYSGLTQRI